MASGRTNAPAFGTRVRRDAADARRVLRTIQQVKNGMYKVKKGGRGGKYLVQRTLHYSGYKTLREELEKEENKELIGYVDNRLRFDYTRRPCKGDKQFVIHMPSAFHEAMAGTFNSMVDRWLGNIADGIIKSFKEETVKIARKRGEIRTVVGLNLNDIYRGGHRATFSEFINENGEVINDCKLPLSLKDFVCATATNRFKEFEDVPFEIPSTKLYELYKYALERHIIAVSMEGIEEVQEKVDDGLEEIRSVEKLTQEKRTEDALRRTFIGKKELTEFKYNL
ncbi:hypothetical protein CIB48_g2632 [Xylaria polymorpha]|nr:hypothetical protein CIB48_g2632 [Xylaria polymorpha]